MRISPLIRAVPWQLDKVMHKTSPRMSKPISSVSGVDGLHSTKKTKINTVLIAAYVHRLPLPTCLMKDSSLWKSRLKETDFPGVKFLKFWSCGWYPAPNQPTAAMLYTVIPMFGISLMSLWGKDGHCMMFIKH